MVEAATPPLPRAQRRENVSCFEELSELGRVASAGADAKAEALLQLAGGDAASPAAGGATSGSSSSPSTAPPRSGCIELLAAAAALPAGDA